MKYTKEERLDIGRRIYEGEYTYVTAAEKYQVNPYTARQYMRLYRDVNGLPHKNLDNTGLRSPAPTTSIPSHESEDLESYKSMTKEELIQALIQSRITEARLKKGYEVKGDGSIIQYSSKNTK